MSGNPKEPGRPRFELREVRDDGSSRVEVCSLREVAGRVGDVALSRRSFWGLSALVGGGLLVACAPAEESPGGNFENWLRSQGLLAASAPAPSDTELPATTPRPAAPTARPAVTPVSSPDPTRPPASTHQTSSTVPPTPTASAKPTDADRLAHGGPVLAVAINPDGALVASTGVEISGASTGAVIGGAGGPSYAAKLWRASDGALLQTLKPRSGIIAPLAFSPDGQTIAAGSSGGSVYLWRTIDGSLARELSWQPASAAPVIGLAFSPDGKLLAATNTQGQVGLWNPATGEWKRALADGKPVAVWPVAFSPDGRTLAVGTLDPGLVRLWNVADGARLIERSIGEVVQSLAWSPDGRRIAVGGLKNVYYLDPATGKSIVGIALAGADPGATSIAFGRDGARIVIGRGDGGLISVVADRGTPSTVTAHTSGPTRLALDGGGTRLVTGGGDGRVRLWEAGDTPRPLNTSFGDPAVPSAGQMVAAYAPGRTDANVQPFSVACGGPIPPGSTCTCNCVPGLQAGSAPAPRSTPIPVATVVPRPPAPSTGGSVPGGSVCTCNKICTCVPVRKYCFVMWK